MGFYPVRCIVKFLDLHEFEKIDGNIDCLVFAKGNLTVYVTTIEDCIHETEIKIYLDRAGLSYDAFLKYHEYFITDQEEFN